MNPLVTWLVGLHTSTVFEDSDTVYFFLANFAKEQDEWMRIISMAG